MLTVVSEVCGALSGVAVQAGVLTLVDVCRAVLRSSLGPYGKGLPRNPGSLRDPETVQAFMFAPCVCSPDALASKLAGTGTSRATPGRLTRIGGRCLFERCDCAGEVGAGGICVRRRG